jgi:hypothetical protein
VPFAIHAYELDRGTAVLRRFSASYSISGSPPAQEFVARAFDTTKNAAAHALDLATQEIDRR